MKVRASHAGSRLGAAPVLRGRPPPSPPGHRRVESSLKGSFWAPSNPSQTTGPGGLPRHPPPALNGAERLAWPSPPHVLGRVGSLPGWGDRTLGLLCCLPPQRGKGLPLPCPEGPSVGSLISSPDPEATPFPELQAHSLLPVPHLSSSSVITVRVKEEHLDVATPDKAPSPELPVPIENIKQETDD